jgi:hypothetical protein
MLVFLFQSFYLGIIHDSLVKLNQGSIRLHLPFFLFPPNNKCKKGIYFVSAQHSTPLNMNPSKLKLQPKTRQQIAEEYGIHRSTFNRKLKRHGIELPKGLVMPKDIRKIYNAMGLPEKYLDNKQA